MKKIKTILVSLLLTLSTINVALAATAPLSNLENLGKESGFSDTQSTDVAMAENIGLGIKLFFNILGIIFVILMIYAGYKWMMAQGDEGEIKKAKNILNRAIIGLIIIVGSFAIWNLISNKLLPV